jgi:hypothetical protein
MTTAALLPATGDPLLTRYWLANYRTWSDEVDELMVLVNGPDTYDAAAMYDAAGATVRVAGSLGHGQALDRLLAVSTADAVVLLEEDGFVRTSGAIASRLERALAGEIIGCPRGGMSPELHEAAREKWGPDPQGPDTSAGYGLWPCFLFVRPDVIRSLPDPRWESLGWDAGQTVPGIGYAGNAVATDTATIIAYQLRERYPITLDVNYKEMWQKDLHGDPPYFHAGGMSANDPADARPNIGMDNNEGRDWAHRFWWWRRVGHDYAEHYTRAGVDPDYWTPIIEPWINWQEGA